MVKVWSDIAWKDYCQLFDKHQQKLIKSTHDLIKDIERNGALNGIGKPEALKYRKGFSQRIDETNRLVYAIDENGVLWIISCRGHY